MLCCRLVFCLTPVGGGGGGGECSPAPGLSRPWSGSLSGRTVCTTWVYSDQGAVEGVLHCTSNTPSLAY